MDWARFVDFVAAGLGARRDSLESELRQQESQSRPLEVLTIIKGFVGDSRTAKYEEFWSVYPPVLGAMTSEEYLLTVSKLKRTIQEEGEIDPVAAESRGKAKFWKALELLDRIIEEVAPAAAKRNRDGSIGSGGT